MQHPIGLAIVGLGLAGGAMVPAVREHPSFRLAAAVDPNPDLRSAFADAEQVPAVADIDQLWTLNDVDAVYIATPHQLHPQQVLAAAKAGRHVIVEKPMALTTAECHDMTATCRREGVQLVVGHTHGFDPAVRWVADAVASDEYGPVGLLTSLNYTDFLYRPRRPEELDEARGGGIMFNQLPHQVDIARTILNRSVTAVKASVTRLDPTRPVAGSCTALLDFADGVSATLVYSGYDHFDSDELYGWVAEGGRDKRPAHGSARQQLSAMGASDEAQARRDEYGYGRRTVTAPTAHPHFGELVVSCARADLRLRPHGIDIYDDRGRRPVQVPLTAWPGRSEVLDELAGAVLDGLSPRHDGEFGAETVRVCLALAESAERGHEVGLAPEQPPTSTSKGRRP